MTTLVIASHPDDEVLGCGASIAKWSKSGESVHILILSEGETSRDTIRNTELKSEEILLLSKCAYNAGEFLGAESIKLLGLPDNRMDSMNILDITKLIEKEINDLKPDTIVTHHAWDLNIDHRITHEAVITACRPQPNHCVKKILSFEVASSTEWQVVGINTTFQPNWFEDVSTTASQKISALGFYKSEMRSWPHARSIENLENLLRWRGSSIGCEAAEAFMLIRKIQ